MPDFQKDGPDIYSKVANVTPSDVADLPEIAHALTPMGAGDIAVALQDGTIVLFPNVPAGFALPVVTQRVYATGTTATNIQALR